MLIGMDCGRSFLRVNLKYLSVSTVRHDMQCRPAIVTKGIDPRILLLKLPHLVEVSYSKIVHWKHGDNWDLEGKVSGQSSRRKRRLVSPIH